MEFKEIFGDKPWIIAGPCSAETFSAPVFGNLAHVRAILKALAKSVLNG